MKLSKTSLFHPFLFALYPIIHLYSHNFIESPFFDALSPMIITLVITCIFLIITKLVVKDWTKTGFIISLLLILSFSYGHIYELLNSSVSENFEIGRHRYLMVIFFATFVIGTILILRKNINNHNLTVILNAISVTLILITIPNFVIDNTSSNLEIQTSQEIHNTIYPSTTEINFELNNLEELNPSIKPDLYYILLDGYGGTMRMKEDLNFDNYEFLSELTSRGFFAPDISHSNYPSSKWQMTTVFSMNYLPPITSGQTDLDYHNLLDEIQKNNEVMRNFDYLNYDIINFQTNGFIKQKYTYGDHTFCEQEESSQSKFEKTLLRTTILRYLANQIVLNADRQSILCGFEKISSQGEKFENPVFVYMHLRLPHPPHIFGPNGEFVIGSKALTEEGSFVDEGKYVDSIKFANKKTIQVVDDILKHNKKSIIIIQSDHGYDFGIDYINPSSDVLKQRFSNLNAIYLPDGKQDVFYEGITPVNTFRIIFNQYFGTSYQILDDKMFYHPYSGDLIHKQPIFKDITETILN